MGPWGRFASSFVSLILRTPGDFITSRLPFTGLQPGCVQQSGLLILTDIPPGQEKLLQTALDSVRNKLLRIQKSIRDSKKTGQPFQKSSLFATKTAHYAAWMVLPGIKAKNKSGSVQIGKAQLLFETNYDGCLDFHLHDLVTNCREELDLVYSHFSDYPEKGVPDAAITAFLKANCQLSNNPSKSTSVYYVALPGRMLEDIENAITVYDEAKTVIDDPSKKWKDKKSIRTAIVDHFKNLPPGKSEKKPKRFPITQRGLRAIFAINMFILAVLCLVPPAFYLCFRSHSLPFLPIWGFLPCSIPLFYVIVWLVIDAIASYFEQAEESKERKLISRGEVPFDPTDHEPEYTHLDIGRQNHMCTFATVKPGWFRMFVLKKGLWLGSILSRHIFILGRLDQMSTVHFARWSLIGDQLLFYGNYDGSWSSYLTDFSDEAWAVNMLWGNTIGFPETKFIVFAGARDLEGFQMQAVTHYAPALVFYTAYGDHSLVNLMRYLEFRDGLLDELGM